VPNLIVSDHYADNGDMAVTVSFRPSRADLLRSGLIGLEMRPWVMWAGISIFVLLPWATAVFVCVMEASTGRVFPRSSLIELILLPPFTVAGFASIPFIVTRGARTLDGEHVYEFDDWGSRLTGPGFDNRVAWSTVTRCHASRMGLLFLTGSLPIITVPARVLSPSSKTALRDLVSGAGVKVTGRWKP
jgi:hypothetical protein